MKDKALCVVMYCVVNGCIFLAKLYDGITGEKDEIF